MTLNEALARQTFITKVPLRYEDKELSKETKAKVMSIRIELGKLRRMLDEDLQEVVKDLKPVWFDELLTKEVKTDEESKRLEEATAKINEEYNAFVNESGKGNVEFSRVLTEDEYMEIVDIMPSDDIDINGVKINVADFLEVLYSLFVA